MTELTPLAQQFYLTRETECSYLPYRKERKVFTHVVGEDAASFHDLLAHGGFRRSQTVAYRPACDACQACVSVRVCVNDFMLSKSFKRVMAANADIIGVMGDAVASPEHYTLFHHYLATRHAEGGMAGMEPADFTAMVQETHVRTRLVEYRLKDGPSDENGNTRLMGVALTDILADGLSMVYSFYDPAEAHRSFGTYIILEHIARARRLGMPYVYLGYWVDGSPKMTYKRRFLPQERLTSRGWELILR